MDGPGGQDGLVDVQGTVGLLQLDVEDQRGLNDRA